MHIFLSLCYLTCNFIRVYSLIKHVQFIDFDYGRVYVCMCVHGRYVLTRSNIKDGNREYSNVTFFTQHYS